MLNAMSMYSGAINADGDAAVTSTVGVGRSETVSGSAISGASRVSG